MFTSRPAQRSHEPRRQDQHVARQHHQLGAIGQQEGVDRRLLRHPVAVDDGQVVERHLEGGRQ